MGFGRGKGFSPVLPPPPEAPAEWTLVGTSSNRSLQGSAVTWPGAHNAGSGTILTNYDSPNYALMAGSYLSAGWHYIWRQPLFFDTSILSRYTITGARLRIYVFTKGGPRAAFPNMYIVEGVQHDPVIASDYGAERPYTTIWASIDMTTVATGQYNDLPFTAAGLAGINKSGVTRLCLRNQEDVDDTNPLAVYNSYLWYYSQQKGAGYWPLLVVELS